MNVAGLFSLIGRWREVMLLVRKCIFVVVVIGFLPSCAGLSERPVRIDLTKDQAEIRLRGWMGVNLLKLSDDLREDLKAPAAVRGLVIYAVGRDTAAHNAGLLPGDIIRSINGDILVRDDQISQYPPGTVATLEIWRGGKAKIITVVLEYREPDLGIAFPEPTPPRTEDGLACVVEWYPASEAYARIRKNRKGLATYLISLNGVEIADKASFEKELSRFMPGDTVTICAKSIFLSERRKVTCAWEATLRLGERTPLPVAVQFDSSSAAPQTHVVAQDGSGDFKTLHGALLVSAPGDTIELGAGDYGGLHIPFSNRTVRGAGEGTVFDWIRLQDIADVTLENLSVRKGDAVPELIVIERASDISLRKLRVQGGRAIIINDSDNVSIGKSHVSGARTGIHASASQLRLSNSLLTDNTSAIFISKGSAATLESNTIVGSEYDALGISDSRVEAYDNLFAFNQHNIWHKNSQYTGGHNNYFRGKMDETLKQPTDSTEDPLFADQANNDYRLSPHSPLINKSRAGSYIGAFPAVRAEPGE